MIYTILLVMYQISILLYLLGTILVSTKVRVAIEELWYKTESGSEKYNKTRLLSLIQMIYSSIYLKNDKLSFLKLAIITVLTNGSFLIGIFLAQKNNLINLNSSFNQFFKEDYTDPLEIFVFLFLVFLFFCSSFITEFVCISMDF